MKSPVASSSHSQKRPRRDASRGTSVSSTKGLAVIKCGFCQNTFAAAPRLAVCHKCKRPANRSLTAPGALLCLALFPVGLFKAALLRSSQPYAAMQAFFCSLAGGGAWGALYLLLNQS